MTIRHLKIFAAVCEHGGVTKAAEAIHIAQPAVSHTVAELEKYYKVALFDRINQRLVLTDMGRELLERAKAVISEFDEFERLAFQGGSNPKLRIGASLTLGKTVLPRILVRMREELPEIALTVTVNKTSEIESAIERGEIDIGMVEGEITSPYLNTHPFGGDCIAAVCAKKLSVSDRIGVEELSGLPMLLRERGSASREAFDKAIASCGVTVKPFMESVSNECIVSAALEGLGVAVLPEELVSEYIEAGRLKKLTLDELELSRRHSLVIHKNKRLNPLQSKALELCLNIYNFDVEKSGANA